MTKPRLILIDPGHFHAALVQKEMYEGLSPRAHVYAQLGPELIDYLGRIARFNAQAEMPTAWQLRVEAAPDFLARLAQEPPGGVAVIAGRNGVKIDRIEAAVEAGLHVLADKPAIIRREDLSRLEAMLSRAAERGLVVHDLMTGRQDEIGRVIRALRNDPEVFGEPVPGNAAEPGVRLSNVHQLLKHVAGVPNRRPSWYFDITEQGEALADTGTHLVDRVHETLFPGEALDYRHDIRLHSANHWPTRLSLAQFREVTGEAVWPDFLMPWLKGDTLDYFCNGRLHYEIRSIHVALECRWDWQTEATAAAMPGSNCGRARRRAIGRSSTSYPKRRLRWRSNAGSLRCRRSCPGSASTGMTANGGSSCRACCAADTRRISPPSPGSSWPMWQTPAHYRRAFGPIFWRSIM
jgi:hypothetical protein